MYLLILFRFFGFFFWTTTLCVSGISFWSCLLNQLLSPKHMKVTAPLWQDKWMSGDSYLDGFQILSCLPISSLFSLLQNLFFKYSVTEIFGNASLVFWEWLSSKDLQNRLHSNPPKLNLCLLKKGSNGLSYSKIFMKSSSADHCVSILFQSYAFLLACNSVSLEEDT